VSSCHSADGNIRIWLADWKKKGRENPSFGMNVSRRIKLNYYRKQLQIKNKMMK